MRRHDKHSLRKQEVKQMNRRQSEPQHHHRYICKYYVSPYRLGFRRHSAFLPLCTAEPDASNVFMFMQTHEVSMQTQSSPNSPTRKRKKDTKIGSVPL